MIPLADSPWWCKAEDALPQSNEITPSNGDLQPTIPGNTRIPTSFDDTIYLDENLEGKLQAWQRALRLLAKENQELAQEHEALLHTVDHSARLCSLLANVDPHTSFLPSARVGSHPVEDTAWLVFETAWSGGSTRKECLQVWTVMPTTFMLKLEVEFKDRLQKHATQWAGANPKERRHEENVIYSAFRLRDSIGALLSSRCPGTLVDYYKSTLPPTELGGQQQLARIVAQMGLTEDQRFKICSLWTEYSYLMKMAADRTEVAKLALTQAGKRFCAEGICNMRAQAEKASFLATYIQDLNNCLVNSIIVYQRLIEAMSPVFTWKQRVSLVLGSRPYLPSWSQLCDLVAKSQ